MYVKNKTKLDTITIDDLIQEIASLNNIQDQSISDKERRKRILDTYFKGNNIGTKLPSKAKMEKALKNINYEMDKAAQEFSKLFQTNEYQK